MEAFNWLIEGKYNKFSVIFFGDTHEGNINFNEPALDCFVRYTVQRKKEYNVGVIGIGDMVDCIKHDDPRFSPVEIAQKYSLKDLKDLPRRQMQYMAKKLDPIKEDIKYCLIGNHEESYIKHNGFDVYDYFCTDLLPNCTKLGFIAIGNLIFKRGTSSRIVKTALSHGTGGGGFREGYPMNHCMDIFKKFNCDLHVMGHLHKLESRCFEYLTTNQKGNMVKDYIFYGISGSFLETHVVGQRNYYEGKKGMPSDIGFLEFTAINSGGKWHLALLKHRWMNGKFQLV